MNNIPDNITQIILESISDGVFTVNHHWQITMFNRAAEKITGIPRATALGKKCWEVFRSNMCEGDCALKKTMREGKPFISASTYIVNSEKKRIPVTASTSLLKNENGQIMGGVEIFRDHSLVEELRRELSTRFCMGDMVSKSPAMQKIFRILPQIAENDSAVLIQGETGVGKELMSRAIHNASFRKKRPFVAVNCGALPDSLLESELFGYKKGAFTHATKDKPGLFDAAKGGTLLLDEIGETSPAFQISLLRVLENKEFTPLGGTKTVTADVRIIAATNKNLSDMVKQGGFRQDLFYRINVLALSLPPLRRRMEDLPDLVEHFVTKLNRIRDKQIAGVDEDALKILMSHTFPGNIRELENIIEHGFALCRKGAIGVDHLPMALCAPPMEPEESDAAFFHDEPRAQPSIRPHEPGTAANLEKPDPIKMAEIKMIAEALDRNQNNRTAAARDLGMHKSTLFRKIKRLGIQNAPRTGV